MLGRLCPGRANFEKAFPSLTQSKTPKSPVQPAGDTAPMIQARDGFSQARDATVWAAVSHEIRTPLTGVMGMLEILGHTSLTEEQRRIIATAEASSLALLRIVDDVLDFAKLESTLVTLAPAPTDIGALAEDCAAILAAQAGAKGLVVTCETDGRLPRVICDQVRVRQLLVNLGGNAVKFTDQGGVAITAQMTAVTTVPAMVGLRLSVRDSGIGIPDALRPFLFQPFSRLATFGPARSGAGLGLAICRRIVEIMGGSISIDAGMEGQAGGSAFPATILQGSVFHVDLTLPIAAEACGPGPALTGVHVLAVEGDRATAIALRYLKEAGATIVRLRNLGEIAQRLGPQEFPPRGPALIVLGPDAESEDIAAVCRALETMAQDAPKVLWLRPRAAGAPSAPSPSVKRGVESVGAHPLRRADLLAAAKRAVDPTDAYLPAAPLAVVTRRPGTGFAAVREDSMASARAEGRVVLVAEDNPTNQDVLRQQLSILGYDCDIAPDGASALRAFAAGRYLVMLCDCHMPGIDGFELTRRLRAAENGASRLPIIAVTANAVPGEAARCLDAGMDDYLAKPIEIRTLGAMLDRWVAPAYRSPNAIPSDPQPPRAAGAPARIIDTRNLEAVYGADPERLARVLADWRSGLENAIRTIAVAMAAARPDAAIEAAHSIKGSAGIAGAYSLSAEAGALETALRNGDHRTALQAARRLERLAVAAIGEVAQTTPRAGNS
jgi:CheY-like chemotaxis protein